MIPKKIHYCWFGRNPLPEDAQKCIESWRKFLPDYEVIEWNEDNFDVNSITYTTDAYNAKKYAFVSDYARFKILYEHGGLYFDTDVEVIKSFDDIIAQGPFMGFEIDPKGNTSAPFEGNVAPGLGLGAVAEMGFYKKVLEAYGNFNFLNSDGSLNLKTVVKYNTELLLLEGLKNIQGIQHIAGINIYPAEYFNPLDDNTGRLKITCKTHSIHWYSKTWLNESRFRRKVSRLSHRLLGTKIFPKLRRLIKK